MIDRWKLYDLIYAKAGKLLKQYNPCNIRIENDKLICNNKKMCKRNGESLCCGGCKFLEENGCTTNCLECKVGWCWQGENANYTFNNDLQHITISQVFINKMDKLRKIMFRYKLGGLRNSKKTVFYFCPILEEVTV